ncbi:MAG TPA: hypothetical protein VF721_08795 [Pyrinomonadaceae bacterium]|jgi:hypothetical protein
MKEKHIQILGICLTLLYGLFVAWLYVAAPKSLVELPSKAQQTFDKATTTAQVMTNTYEIDQAKFNEGLQAFRQDNFVLARDAFARADTEKRDARTQFYIAYSLYRQGWGRISNDDTLFRQGLETVNRVIALDNNFKSDDADLKLKTPIELKAELEQGLQVTADDFNPLKVFRERK